MVLGFGFRAAEGMWFWVLGLGLQRVSGFGF